MPALGYFTIILLEVVTIVLWGFFQKAEAEMMTVWAADPGKLSQGMRLRILGRVKARSR